MPQGRCKDHQTLWMLLPSKGSTSPHKLMALLCFSAVVKTSRVKRVVHPQRCRELLPQGRHLGGLPTAWTVNNLVHGKGLTSLTRLCPPTPPLPRVSSRKRWWRANHWWDCFPTGSSTRCEEGDGDAGMSSPAGHT